MRFNFYWSQTFTWYQSVHLCYCRSICVTMHFHFAHSHLYTLQHMLMFLCKWIKVSENDFGIILTDTSCNPAVQVGSLFFSQVVRWQTGRLLHLEMWKNPQKDCFLLWFFICILSFCTYPHQLFRRMQLQQTWVRLCFLILQLNRITSTITLWACVWRETTAKQQKLRQKEHFVSSKRQNWYWKWNTHKFGNITLKSLTHIPTQQSQKGTRATSRTWKPVLCQKESVLLLCLYLLSLLIFRIPRGDSSDVMG